MSSYRYAVKSISQRTPFCGICKNAGKTHKEYTSHFVRDRPGADGRVVCPTLLASICRYCRETGHIKSHCPKLADKNRQEKERARIWYANERRRAAESNLQTQVEAAKATRNNDARLIRLGLSSESICKKNLKPKNDNYNPQKPFTGNAFAVWECDSSDDEQDEKVATQAAPAVVAPKKASGVWGNGSAAIAIASSESKPQAWSMQEVKVKKRVSFTNDNIDTLMKPVASEVRTYIKGSPTNSFVEKDTASLNTVSLDDDASYMASKQSSNAWRPASRQTQSYAYNTSLQPDEEFRAISSSRDIETVRKDLKQAQQEYAAIEQEDDDDWGTAGQLAEIQEDIDRLQNELEALTQNNSYDSECVEAYDSNRVEAYDDFGRPLEDNSAW